MAPGYLALGVDHEQSTLAQAVPRAIHAVLACDLTLGLEICEQREVQLARAREGAVTPGAIHGDTEQLGVVALELFKHLVVERHLVSTHRAPVGRIKGKHHGPALEVTQGYFLVGGRRKYKV